MKNSKFRKKLLEEFEKIKDRVEEQGGSDLAIAVKDSDCGFIDWLKSGDAV